MPVQDQPRLCNKACVRKQSKTTRLTVYLSGENCPWETVSQKGAMRGAWFPEGVTGTRLLLCRLCGSVLARDSSEGTFLYGRKDRVTSGGKAVSVASRHDKVED